MATAGAEDVPFARTEGPRETLGSFLQLKDELEMRVSSYLQDHSRADFERLTTVRDVAEDLFDLSAVPEAARDEVAADVLYAMLDIFDRIDVPPLQSVPLAEDFDPSSASAGWRIPDTPLRIGRVDAGHRQGRIPFHQKDRRHRTALLQAGSPSTVAFPR